MTGYTRQERDKSRPLSSKNGYNSDDEDVYFDKTPKNGDNNNNNTNNELTDYYSPTNGNSKGNQNSSSGMEDEDLAPSKTCLPRSSTEQYQQRSSLEVTTDGVQEADDDAYGPTHNNTSQQQQQQQEEEEETKTKKSHSPRTYRRLLLVSNLFFVLASILYLVMAVDDLDWAKQVESEDIPVDVLTADDDVTWSNFRMEQQQQQAEEEASNNNNNNRRLLRATPATLGSLGRRQLVVAGMYDDSFWAELPPDIQAHAETLGYSQESWDEGQFVYTEFLDWDELTKEQQRAAEGLGYDEELWDGTNSFETPTESTTLTTTAPVGALVMNAQEEGAIPTLPYEGQLWDDLPQPVQFSAQVLGFSQQRWDEGLPPRLLTEFNPDWDELTTKQQQAAAVLGYDASTWWYIKRDMETFQVPVEEVPITLEDEEPQQQEQQQQEQQASPDEEWYDYDWGELPDNVQQAYISLGWSEDAWDGGWSVETDTMDWASLSAQQQQAAIFLGYSEELWDGPDTTSTTTTATTETEASPVEVALEWDDYDWTELPPDVQASYMVLGYSEEIWDNGDSVFSDELSWEELSMDEQTAALTIGYTQEIWDGPTTAPPLDATTPDTDTMAPEAPATQETTESTAPDAEYYDSYWVDLPQDVRDAYTALGYTEQSWNEGDSVESEDSDWTELTPEQQKAATFLGYNQALWDNAPTSAILTSAYVSVDDDYIFKVSTRREEEVWVSRYMILYFSAALCFVLMGLIDWIRERKWFHIFMILAGLFGLISAMLVEKDRTASNACNLISVHFFFLEGLHIMWYHFQSRKRSKASSDEEMEHAQGATGRETSIMSGLWWIPPLVMSADVFFVLGAFLDVILSYFYFERSSDWNLALARVFGFSSLLWLASALMYLLSTLVVQFGWFPCCVGGDKMFIKRGVVIDQRQKELADMNYVSPLPTQESNISSF